ncbi:MAG: hypothetical protein ACREV3_13185 [Gammaproteobacteria bacterium]
MKFLYARYIPVTNREVDLALPAPAGVPIESSSIAGVREAVQRALILSPHDRAVMSRAAEAHYEAESSIAAFRHRLADALAQVLG